MSGLDVLVIARGVFAGGVGFFCYVTEHLGADKEETVQKEIKEGEGK